MGITREHLFCYLQFDKFNNRSDIEGGIMASILHLFSKGVAFLVIGMHYFMYAVFHTDYRYPEPYCGLSGA